MEKATIERFSQFNAKNLTPEELKSMQDFTVDDLKDLAAAYRNQGNQKAYLILLDKGKPENKQVFPLSTWENLYNLYRLGNKQYVAYSFKSIFNRQAQRVKKVAPVQDLTKEQVAQELKSQPTQKAVKKAAAPKATAKTAVPVAQAQTAKATTPKSFAKMNVDELAVEFKNKFKKDAPANAKKKDLVAALEGKK